MVHLYYHNLVTEKNYKWLLKKTSKKIKPRKKKKRTQLKEMIRKKINQQKQRRNERNPCICGAHDAGELDLKKNKKNPNLKINKWHVTLSIKWHLDANANKKPLNDKIEEWKKYRLICQGVMVSKKHVLTPYHCLEEKGNHRYL